MWTSLCNASHPRWCLKSTQEYFYLYNKLYLVISYEETRYHWLVMNWPFLDWKCRLPNTINSFFKRELSLAKDPALEVINMHFVVLFEVIVVFAALIPRGKAIFDACIKRLSNDGWCHVVDVHLKLIEWGIEWCFVGMLDGNSI